MKNMPRTVRIALLILFASTAMGTVRTAGQIEADWARQDVLRRSDSVLTQQDAAGGCDGVKNGQFGFHTAHENRPWWQVDLGRPYRLDHMLVYNRVDFVERASHLSVSVSDDGRDFRRVYEHDGTVFRGFADKKPLRVSLDATQARYVRLQLPTRDYFHLDEVEIFAVGDERNVALRKPATQSSTSQWSRRSAGAPLQSEALRTVLDRGFKLAQHLRSAGVDVNQPYRVLQQVEKIHSADDTEETIGNLYRRARRAVRGMALANPLLDFDDILFVKRAPGSLPHISDQYYGWWSRPGGGIYILRDFKSDRPGLNCLTHGWPAGNFLRPALSYDARKVLFAYCRYYPHVATMEKVDKDRLPEDAFYQVFEMNIDGTDVRQLTFGRYDDFDARYLPDGRIVFLSTRKGQFLQCTAANTRATFAGTCPDSYVRCGGDNVRPCAVYTLHTMNADGSDMLPISAFETFEYTPSIADDGRILYARWDYIDRFNGHFFSLWSANQNGGNPQLVYGNFTTRPQAVLEARSIPNCDKLIFTAGAHHSITGGSLVLLDPALGTEGETPITRITPEVSFPETEQWEDAYYANPYPLSEDFYLVAWSDRRLPPHAGSSRIIDQRNPVNATGIYLYDRFGNLELLTRDEQISSMYPIPIRPRIKPPTQPNNADWSADQRGCFLVQDIYQGLKGVERGAIRRLRIVGVVPKVQPHMNQPNLGVSKEDPGKFVLGTVPVESDGSAFFRVPSGLSVFFQALDERGLAVQTMRTLTYVQPGQTLSCIGCHEARSTAPTSSPIPIAAKGSPSKITPGPEGSWPLRFDRLVQPVLDRHCVECHRPDGEELAAAAFDLTAVNSYSNLLAFADEDLTKLAFEKDRSIAGQCPAATSRLLALLLEDEHRLHVELDPDSFQRLVTWMDTYAHRLGSFSRRQEQQLMDLRRRFANIMAD